MEAGGGPDTGQTQSLHRVPHSQVGEFYLSQHRILREWSRGDPACFGTRELGCCKEGSGQLSDLGCVYLGWREGLG